jgi:hypothetical protein
MRFVLNAALSVGVVLAVSPAWAEDANQTDNKGMDSHPMAAPQEETPSPGAPAVTPDEAYPQHPVQEQPIERPESMKPPEETRSYSTTTTTKEEHVAAAKHGPGFEFLFGGGVQNYTSSDLRAVTNVGGFYTGRLAIGTRIPVGLEVGYIGTTQKLTAIGLNSGADLLSNGVEGTARLNLMPKGIVRPYVVGGAGWKRYDIVNKSFNTSNVRNQLDVATFPLGAGLSFVYRGLVLDARGEYRWEAKDQILQDLTTGPGTDNWDVNLKAGFEF